MAPAVPGAVAVSVNLAVPVAAPADSPGLSVTEQLSSAPLTFKGVQLTTLTPVPAVAAVTFTPAGSRSLTVAVVPEVAEPLLPRPRV